MHEEVHGPAVRRDRVVEVIEGRLELSQHVWVLETHKLCLGRDGDPRQKLVHIIPLLQQGEIIRGRISLPDEIVTFIIILVLTRAVLRLVWPTN